MDNRGLLFVTCSCATRVLLSADSQDRVETRSPRHAPRGDAVRLTVAALSEPS